MLSSLLVHCPRPLNVSPMGPPECLCGRECIDDECFARASPSVEMVLRSAAMRVWVSLTALNPVSLHPLKRALDCESRHSPAVIVFPALPRRLGHSMEKALYHLLCNYKQNAGSSMPIPTVNLSRNDSKQDVLYQLVGLHAQQFKQNKNFSESVLVRKNMSLTRPVLRRGFSEAALQKPEREEKKGEEKKKRFYLPKFFRSSGGEGTEKAEKKESKSKQTQEDKEAKGSPRSARGGIFLRPVSPK